MVYAVVDLLPNGENQVFNYYTRQCVMDRLDISSPTVSRYISLIVETCGHTKYLFDKRSRLYNEKQFEILSVVNRLYKKGMTTDQVKKHLRNKTWRFVA